MEAYAERTAGRGDGDSILFRRLLAYAPGVATLFPIIIGPTAGGKSDLAVDVALILGGRDESVVGEAGVVGDVGEAVAGGSGGAEIITADSVQIYRGLDIGSAKPTEEERRGIRHHLIDIVEPADRFTVADWLTAAEGAIADIRRRGRIPIVAGGTHLYIKALLEGLFEGPEPDPALREQLRIRGLPALREELERIDPAAVARIHPNDERRTIRALEVFHQTGMPISQLQMQWDRAGERKDTVLIGLDWPTELLNRRINARVKGMMERGLLDEVRELCAAGRLGPQAREALGYKQLLRHLGGGVTLDEAVEQIKKETRRFAKNQRTWLRRLRTTPGSIWIDCAAGGVPREQWPAVVVGACCR